MFVKLHLEDGSIVIVKKEDISRVVVDVDADSEPSLISVVYCAKGEEPVLVRITNDYWSILRMLEVE